MFRLLRYFSIASLISMAAASALLGWLYREISIRDLVAFGQDHNVDMTLGFANALWPRFAPLAEGTAGMTPEQMRARPEIAPLEVEVADLAKGLSIAKIKIYDRRGWTVFSTEARQIGEDSSGNEGVRRSLAGEIVSELVYRDRFSALEGVIEQSDLISTYVPLLDRDGRVAAIFELYDNVTPMVTRIERTQWQVTGAVVAVFTLLYAVLFLIVRRADRLMARQAARLERTQYTVDNAGDMVFWVDPRGRFIYVNETSCRKLGYAREELLRMNVSDIDPVAPPNPVPAIWDQLRRDGQVRLESMHRTRAGQTFPVEVVINHVAADGQEMGCAFVRDLSARVQMETRLRDTLAEMQIILDNASVGIALVIEGRYARVNRRQEELFGYDRGTLLGRPVESLFASAQRFAELRADAYPKLREGRDWRGEAELRRHDGSTFWCGVHGRAIDPADMGKGSIWILEDLSERRRYETELVRARDAAEGASRAKGQFLANISHELMTPLNAVLNLTRLTLLEEALEGEGRENLETVLASALELERLITGVLKFSELDAGRVVAADAEFDPRRLVADAAAACADAARRKGLVLRREVPPELPGKLLGDGRRIAEILANLTGNAVKFTDRGTVSIGAALEGEGESLQLCFEVQDTGPGIPEALRATIFEAFSMADASASRRHGGLGLGLTLSSRLASALGGTLEFDCPESGGSVFRLRVPVREA